MNQISLSSASVFIFCAWAVLLSSCTKDGIDSKHTGKTVRLN
ncbi:MAG: hypothetical protein UZ12_BCD005003180 [Bacteroidetes bacterium OLB12]|nr:MAG: hypothetical protein UZ12_BCD005003180 [Bacteroidetes bacterium OLB12]